MDARAGLKSINCATLITVGDYDPITPVVCSEEIQASLPSGLGKLEVFAGVGHGVHRDDPSGAEKVLRQFLAS